MSIQETIEEIKKIQTILLVFLEEETDDENNFNNLKNIFEEQKIHEDKHKLMSFLHLFSKIIKNHHHGPNFFDRIFCILQYFQEDIKKYYHNSEIFNIFSNNKRILLFLIEQKILIFDEYVIRKLVTKYDKYKYTQYFLPEFKAFLDEQWFVDFLFTIYTSEFMLNFKYQEVSDDFYEKRKIGQKESYICQLIRKDSIEDFITYVNKNNIPLKSEIETSIFETNSFLLKIENELIDNSEKTRKITLIEYAAFFGSIRIFKYLQRNEVKLTPSIWLFAIHSHNPELIAYLEQIQNDAIQKDIFIEAFNESIKCHHNNIANYIYNNLLDQSENILNTNVTKALKYYNYSFIQQEQINENVFFDVVKYGHYLIAEKLFESENVDINKINI